LIDGANRAPVQGTHSSKLPSSCAFLILALKTWQCYVVGGTYLLPRQMGNGVVGCCCIREALLLLWLTLRNGQRKSQPVHILLHRPDLIQITVHLSSSQARPESPFISLVLIHDPVVSLHDDLLPSLAINTREPPPYPHASSHVYS
jgi:hypothetical protein